MMHSNRLVALVQAERRARYDLSDSDIGAWNALSTLVEWAAIWAHDRQHLEQHHAALSVKDRLAVRRSIKHAEQIISEEVLAFDRRPSIPGAQIADPETGRLFAVHPDWPKCRFNSDPAAKAAHNQRLTDPKVLSAIVKVDPNPATCNCEWCVVAQWDFSGPEYAAWLRAHQDAREAWPSTYWERLYPMLAFAHQPVKTEAEAFAG